MPRRKPKSRTISWGQWCEELGTATGVDTAGLRNQDGELLELQDDPEEPEYDDPYDQFDPLLRGKPTNRVWNVTDPPGRIDPEMRQEQTSRDTGRRAGRDEKYREGKNDDDDVRVTQERLRQDHEQLRQIIAELNDRVIAVRHTAPPGLLTNDTLGNECRALAKDAEDTDGLTPTTINTLSDRARALRVKAGQVEQVLAQSPNAPDAVAWALGRPDSDVQHTMQLMRDALNQDVPDSNAFNAAVGELDTFRQLPQQLANDYASLNQRVIEVRHKAPSGLLDNENLGNEYRALEQDVKGAAELTVKAIRVVVQRVKALRDKADKVEQVLAQAPNAETTIIWALGRTEPYVRNAMQRMRDALNEAVPNATVYTTAMDDLNAIKKDAEEYLKQAAKFDYPKTLQTANKAEREQLETQKKIVDDAVGLNTPKAYANALPLLEVLAKAVETCGNAYAERELVLKKPRTDCEGYANRLKIALQRLKSIKSDAFIDLNEKAETQLKEIKLLMSGDGVVVETAVRSATDRLRSLTENTEQKATQEEKRVAEERQLEADRKTYPGYAFDNCTTWAMQPTSWDNRIEVTKLEKTPADTLKLQAIAAGRLGNRGNTSPAAGVAYHCHMIDDGGGGISFTYNHLGGNRVQPVIYDWSTNRQDNKYYWSIAQKTTNTATALPNGVKANAGPPKN